MDPHYIFPLIPIVGVLTLFIGLPWLFLHYITKWKGQRGLSQADERMLEDLWRSARDISHRMETVERILEIRSEPGRDPDAR